MQPLTAEQLAFLATAIDSAAFAQSLDHHQQHHTIQAYFRAISGQSALPAEPSISLAPTTGFPYSSNAGLPALSQFSHPQLLNFQSTRTDTGDSSTNAGNMSSFTPGASNRFAGTFSGIPHMTHPMRSIRSISQGSDRSQPISARFTSDLMSADADTSSLISAASPQLNAMSADWQSLAVQSTSAQRPLQSHSAPSVMLPSGFPPVSSSAAATGSFPQFHMQQMQMTLSERSDAARNTSAGFEAPLAQLQAPSVQRQRGYMLPSSGSGIQELGGQLHLGSYGAHAVRPDSAQAASVLPFLRSHSADAVRVSGEHPLIRGHMAPESSNSVFELMQPTTGKLRMLCHSLGL